MGGRITSYVGGRMDDIHYQVGDNDTVIETP